MLNIYASLCVIFDLNVGVQWIALPPFLYVGLRPLDDDGVFVDACDKAIDSYRAQFKYKPMRCVECKKKVIRHNRVHSAFTIANIQQHKVWMVVNCGDDECKRAATLTCTAKFSEARAVFNKLQWGIAIVRRCHYCRNTREDMAKCGRCGLVYYCSVECQKAERKEHLKICKPKE